VLADLAKNARYIDVRMAAVEYLTDQSALADVAKTAKDSDVRMAAVEKLTDQKVLVDIAMNDCDLSVRIKAAERMSDFVGGGIKKIDHQNKELIKAAVVKLTDQSVLAEIAKNDASKEICVAAAKRLLSVISENDLLCEIAFEGKYRPVPRVEKLYSLDGLAWVAKTEKYSVTKRGIELLNDQNLLADIAKNAKDCDARIASVNKLTGQNVLAEIAKSDKDWSVRLAAVKKLTAQNIIVDIAKNDEDSIVRYTAAEKLTDQNIAQEVYENIAENEKEIHIRITVIEKLTDQSILVDIAKNDTNRYVREAAVKKLTDQKVLVDIAMYDLDLSVRIKAAECLKSLGSVDEIVQIVLKNNDFNVIRKAIAKLEDKNILKDIVKNGKYIEARLLAASKLVHYDLEEDLLMDMIQICGNELNNSKSEEVSSLAAGTLMEIHQKYGRKENGKEK
jgi:hypothetical protein